MTLKKVNSYVVIAIFLATFLFLGATGTLTSGYHFTDDHEIIRITGDLSEKSLIETSAKWITNDLQIRFRPMYYFHRVIESSLFGNNFLAWSLYTGLLAFITFTFFYLGARNLNFSVVESLSFMALSFFGSQMAIWWRLGPAETIGCVFLASSFFFLTRCKKNHLLNTSLFAVFLIFASLCKESFTIIIPAFVILKIWHEKIYFRLNLKQVIFKNYILVFPLLTMSIELITIMFGVNKSSLGYAGVDTNLFSTITGMISIIKESLKNFVTITMFFLVVIFFKLKTKRRIASFLKKLLVPFIFSFLIVLPNLILYAKSGMGERYLLPTTIGIAFFILSIIKEIKTDYSQLSRIFLSAIVIFNLFSLYTPLKDAVAFAREGFYTNSLLSAVTKNSNVNSKVILVADPVGSYEWSISLFRYLSLTDGIKIFVYEIEDQSSWWGDDNFIKNLRSKWHSFFEDRRLANLKQNVASIIFLKKELDKKFFNESKINGSDYKNVLSADSPFALYQKIN